MRKLTLCLGLALIAAVFQASSPGLSASDNATFPIEIQKVLATPEQELDLGFAALVFAKEIYPTLDMATYSRKIDALVYGAKSFIDQQGKYDPDSIVRALNTYLYRVHGLHYDDSENARDKQDNYFIIGILDTK